MGYGYDIIGVTSAPPPVNGHHAGAEVDIEALAAADPHRNEVHTADRAESSDGPGGGNTDEQIIGQETSRFIDGAQFILDAPDEIPAVWGRGQEVLWAEGEALMICGGNGLGKTTLAAQLVRARLGLTDRILGYPVQPGRRRVLYLAMDRPKQIARALGRSFSESERDVLADWLVFWQGPPLSDLAQNPYMLRKMCEHAGADTVIVDSLKDAAVGLSADETGAGYNRARQAATVAGIQVTELHHTVKRNPNGGEPKDLADVYGSAWLTAGAGSVFLLTGQPGDPVVGCKHAKQPMEELGPWQLVHDHVRGNTAIQGEVDPFTWLHARGLNGGTAKELACFLGDTDSPSPAQREKARRKLEKLAEDGLANRIDGGGETKSTARYMAAGTSGGA